MGYRIYIAEEATLSTTKSVPAKPELPTAQIVDLRRGTVFSKFYLYDWIVCDDMENPQFTTRHDYAMTFATFDQAMEYRRRMMEMGYTPHIE